MYTSEIIENCPENHIVLTGRLSNILLLHKRNMSNCQVPVCLYFKFCICRPLSFCLYWLRLRKARVRVWCTPSSYLCGSYPVSYQNLAYFVEGSQNLHHILCKTTICGIQCVTYFCSSPVQTWCGISNAICGFFRSNLISFGAL